MGPRRFDDGAGDCLAARDGPISASSIDRATSPSGPFMTFDYQATRLTMVESQVRTSDVTDLCVQDAMRLAPRADLCPPGKKEIAYAEAEIEYAPGLYLLRGLAIGKLLQTRKPRPGEKALAIAAPYGGQVLKLIG